MDGVIGAITWAACDDCVHSDYGQPCDRKDFDDDHDELICTSFMTHEDARDRMRELAQDAARDEA